MTTTPSSDDNTLNPIQYNPSHPIPTLSVLNQLLLPNQIAYTPIHTTTDTFNVIRDMQVRGAPAIAMVAVLGLLVHLCEREVQLQKEESLEQLVQWLIEQLDYLEESRPTAVNLFLATEELKQILRETTFESREQLIERFKREAEKIIQQGIDECQNIARFGADYIFELTNQKKDLNILTHCNTGALATAKFGTALGVVRFLHKDGHLQRVFATETRPYNQGARLTAFECVFEKIPVTLVVDSAVSYLMSQKKIDAIVVGADRICANGDTANKVGTYQIALSAKFHGVPFFVAAPSTSIDLKLDSGKDIVIEERSSTEITHNMNTKQRVVAEGVETWNPGFDVTPHSLIAGIFTETGVALPQKDGSYDLRAFFGKTKQ